ncbi:MAG: molybdopterin-guanine dinucleotide biosynthesis protein B [Nitrospinales bacterium]
MDKYWRQFKTPFLCFAGYTGTGKTTLLERLIKRFRSEGIRIGYYKHDAHRFTIDREGKDTFRCSRAGAEMVAINDPTHFAVIGDDDFKKTAVTHALEQCDCILIEGYKKSPFDKMVFLDSQGQLPIPADTPGIKAVVHQGDSTGWDPKDSRVPVFHRDEVESIYRFVKSHFYERSVPLYGAVMAGGQSRRMGKPKFSLTYNGKPEAPRMAELLSQFCERVFLSAGAGGRENGLSLIPQCERIDDEHAGLGPVGGLATLMSRYPDHAWLIAACDLPFLRERTLARLLRERDSLKYGTCYLQKGRLGVEPLCAIYEPKFIAPLFEAMSRRELSLSRIIRQVSFKLIQIPEEDRHHFTNVNTPEEYELARKLLKGDASSREREP